MSILAPSVSLGVCISRLCRFCIFAQDLHRQQSYFTVIISIAGISPVRRIINISLSDRIEMDIVQLLVQHLLIANHLRMASLLPHLIRLTGLMALPIP